MKKLCVNAKMLKGKKNYGNKLIDSGENAQHDGENL